MKFCNGFLRRVAHEESGAVIIIVAFLLVALLGMTALAVDVGQLYQVRRQMVTAADAGALAGVVSLIEDPDQDTAELVARNYAIENESEPGDTVVNVIDGHTVEVWSGKTVNYSFARILGFESQLVTAYAKAEYFPVSSAKGIVPWAVDYLLYEKGATFTAKYSHHDDGSMGSGNYHALGLGGSGANRYRDNIKYGYDSVVSIGDWLDRESGNMSGPTTAGTQHRFDLCNCSTGDDGHCIDPENECPRKVMVPLYGDVLIHGNSVREVEVKAFAMIYILNVSGSGNESEVEAIFIEATHEGNYGGDVEDTGVYNVRLIE